MSSTDVPTLAATAVGGAALAYVLMKVFSSRKTSKPHGTIVYYHSKAQGFTGRADSIVRMLEHAGCTYTCKGADEVPENFTTTHACFAVPFVQLPDGLVLSQSQAIHMHLGKTLGLYPATAAGEAKALQVVLNIADVQSEGFGKLKGNQERLAKWFTVFEGTLASSGSGFMVGSSLTYADFACYSWLKIAASVLEDNGKFPLVAQYLAMMANLPSTKAFDAKKIPLLPASMMP